MASLWGWGNKPVSTQMKDILFLVCREGRVWTHSKVILWDRGVMICVQKHLWIQPYSIAPYWREWTWQCVLKGYRASRVLGSDDSISCFFPAIPMCNVFACFPRGVYPIPIKPVDLGHGSPSFWRSLWMLHSNPVISSSRVSNNGRNSKQADGFTF